jgi:hypothetical protein
MEVCWCGLRDVIVCFQLERFRRFCESSGEAAKTFELKADDSIP